MPELRRCPVGGSAGVGSAFCACGGVMPAWRWCGEAPPPAKRIGFESRSPISESSPASPRRRATRRLCAALFPEIVRWAPAPRSRSRCRPGRVVRSQPRISLGCARCGRKRYRCAGSRRSRAVDLRPPWDPDGRARPRRRRRREQPAPLFHSRFRSTGSGARRLRPHAAGKTIRSGRQTTFAGRAVPTGRPFRRRSRGQLARRSAERRGYVGSGDTSESQQTLAQCEAAVRIDTNQPHLDQADQQASSRRFGQPQPLAEID